MSYLILAVSILSVLGSMLGSDFLWSDYDAVQRSRHTELQAWTDAWTADYLRTDDPISLSSYRLEDQLPGSLPFNHRAINVLIHIGSAGLILRLMRQLNVRGALLCSLVFALHPAVVQTLFWPGHRTELLGLLFILLALNFGQAKGKRVYYLLTIATTIVALFIHPAALAIPVLLALIIYFKQRQFSIVQYNRILPILCIVLFVAAWKAPEPSPIGTAETTPIATLGHASQNFFFFFKQALAPIQPSLFYPYDDSPNNQRNLGVGLLPFSLLLPFYIVALIKFRENWSRGLIFGLTAFLVLLTPSLLTQNWNLDGTKAHEDHGLYIALPALMVLIVAGSRAAVVRAEIAGAGLWYTAVGLILTIEVLTAGAFAYTLGSQQRMWTLQSDQWPEQWQPKAALVEYIDTHAPDQLTARERIQLLEQVVERKPDRWTDQYKLLDSYLEVGERNNALKQYRLIVKQGNPDNDFLENAARYFESKGFSREATAARRQMNSTVPSVESSTQ
ncbi:hypothetical protein [Coraliomargarita akajimensis]|uniref:hypothetical protein n=1 Tax=Coraliomargarita akajimensis TaxID=395922 RepID=UPI001C259D2D|nr:hypothetical protein [Coraliomargarita akajimensis]